MEKQPVGPHEFVRLLTIVKVAEALHERFICEKPLTATVRMWAHEIGAVVRDWRASVFDNYPVRLNIEEGPGLLLWEASSNQNPHPRMHSGSEEILRDRYWQMVLLALKGPSVPLSNAEASEVLFGATDAEFASDMRTMQSGGLLAQHARNHKDGSQ